MESIDKEKTWLEWRLIPVQLSQGARTLRLIYNWRQSKGVLSGRTVQTGIRDNIMIYSTLILHYLCHVYISFWEKTSSYRVPFYNYRAAGFQNVMLKMVHKAWSIICRRQKYLYCTKINTAYFDYQYMGKYIIFLNQSVCVCTISPCPDEKNRNKHMVS